MARVQPAVVGMAERIEFADVDHAAKVAFVNASSSVMTVTAIRLAAAHHFVATADVGSATRKCLQGNGY